MATGAFYSPLPLASYLVRRTLGPLVRDAEPDRILSLRIVDPAMGSGAFLVAACRYLARAYERSLVECGGCHPSDFGEPERAAIRRAIAERCLYGVDVNPMAVQLARLSLWLATLVADWPLTFFDHHLQTGDSLLGAWIANLRRAPSLRAPRGAKDRAALPLFDEDAAAGALKAALPIRFTLEDTPADTIDQVRAKERALAALDRRDTLLSKWKRVADVWCAPWFATTDAPVPASAFGALTDVVLTGSGSLASAAAARYLDAAAGIARTHRMFHWELEFPEVFFDAEGRRLPDAGFDALVGFDNQQAVFPIHRSVRFLLLTASRGSPTQSMACRLGERDPGTLEDLGDEPAATSAWFPVRVTPAFLQRVSGEDLAIPDI